MKSFRTNRRRTLAVATGLAVPLLAGAQNITWTGGAGDGQWGTPANWSGGTVPGSANRVILPVTGQPADKRIRLGADRTINALQFSETGNYVIVDGEGLYSLTLASGNCNGGSSITVNTTIAADVVLGASGTWQSPDNYGSMVNCHGNVTDQGNGYGVVFGGSHNNRFTLGGDWTIGGTITAQCLLLPLGSIYTNAAGTVSRGGTVTARGIYLDCRFGFADNSDTEFILENSHEANSDRIKGDTKVGALRAGGVLRLRGNATTPVAESIAQLDLQSGRLAVVVNGLASGVATDLTLEDIQRTSGSALALSTTVGGRIFVQGAANANGLWQPWCFFGSHFAKVGVGGDLVTAVNADYATPAATGNSSTSLYRFADASLTLGEDSAMSALRWDGASAQTLDLGTYDLTLGSGAMVVVGSNNKTLSSSGGGRLVFGGEDVVLYVEGSGACVLAAPVAWSKPAGSTLERPSLVFVRGGRTDGIFLNGEDAIGQYGALFASGYYNTRCTIVFGGPSDRTFHGPVNGVFNIEKRGTGTLTFAGANERRSGTTSVVEGRMVAAHASAPTPTIGAGAVGEIAAGVSFTGALVVQAGGTLSGLGAVARDLTATHLASGARIAPGSPTTVGTLSTTGHVTPGGNLTLAVRLGMGGNDILQVANNFNKPPSGSTLTVVVSDASNGQAPVKDQTFVVMTWGGTLGNTANTLNFAVENGSPSKLDTGDATLAIDGKNLVLSGLRYLAGGTSLMIR